MSLIIPKTNRAGLTSVGNSILPTLGLTGAGGKWASLIGYDRLRNVTENGIKGDLNPPVFLSRQFRAFVENFEAFDIFL